MWVCSGDVISCWCEKCDRLKSLPSIFDIILSPEDIEFTRLKYTVLILLRSKTHHLRWKCCYFLLWHGLVLLLLLLLSQQQISHVYYYLMRNSKRGKKRNRQVECTSKMNNMNTLCVFSVRTFNWNRFHRCIRCKDWTQRKVCIVHAYFYANGEVGALQTHTRVYTSMPWNIQ